MSQNEQKDKVLTNGFFVKSHPAQTGWWYAYPSEKSWSERQLGWWNSQYMESHNPFMFQTTNQPKNVRKKSDL